MKFLLTLAIVFCLTPFLGFSQIDTLRKIIVLDPRYSFRNDNKNNDYASEILQKVKDQLTNSGHKVFLTTGNAEEASLNERLRFTKEKNADLYLSLSFYDVDQTKYGRKQKDLLENYRIYPIVTKSLDTAEFTKAKAISTALQSEILQKRSAQAKIFKNAFVYDIPHYGMLLSINYKPGTNFYRQLHASDYQQTLAETLTSAIERLL